MLSTSASRASALLELRTEEAEVARRAQEDASRSAEQLSDFLTQLAHQTQEEMFSINGTAAAVREGLLKQSQLQADPFGFTRWGEWVKAAVLWLLQIVLRGK